MGERERQERREKGDLAVCHFCVGNYGAWLCLCGVCAICFRLPDSGCYTLPAAGCSSTPAAGESWKLQASGGTG